jgi:DNA-binding NarL/FixJ family response regulator
VRLFIADDSMIIRERIRGLVSGIEGIELTGEAGNVQGSITGFLDTRPDVLILDIRMPGGSGLDVLRRAKENTDSPAVIILTNYPFPEYRDIAARLGADYFFDKSTEFEEMAKVLKRLVREKENGETGVRDQGSGIRGVGGTEKRKA